MSAADQYLHGSWNVICQRCSFKYKAHQLQKNWEGFYVCKGPGTQDCWEWKHPQLSVKSVPDNQSVVKNARVEPTPQYVDVTYVDSTIGVQE